MLASKSDLSRGILMATVALPGMPPVLAGYRDQTCRVLFEDEFVRLVSLRGGEVALETKKPPVAVRIRANKFDGRFTIEHPTDDRVSLQVTAEESGFTIAAERGVACAEGARDLIRIQAS